MLDYITDSLPQAETTSVLLADTNRPVLTTAGIVAPGISPVPVPPSGGTGAVTLIQTQILTADVATVTFASIPQTFTHLMMRVVAASTALIGDALLCTINGDTNSSNYQQIQWLLGQGNGILAGRAIAPYCPLMNICQINSVTQQPSLTGYCTIDIPAYNSTVFNKCFLSLGAGADMNGIEIQPQSSYWLSKAAITDMEFSLQQPSALFVAGSIFSLYGIQ